MAVTTRFRTAALVVVVAKVVVVVVVVEVVVVGAVVVVVEEATVVVEVPLVDDEHAASNRAALATAAAARIFRFIGPPHPRPGRTLSNVGRLGRCRGVRAPLPGCLGAMLQPDQVTDSLNDQV